MSDSQLTLIDEVPESDQVEKKDTFRPCRYHPWANSEKHFEPVQKRNGVIKLRCSYCESQKSRDKEIRSSFWHKEKEDITDLYVKTVLKSGRNALKTEPAEELIDATRAVIKLKRLVKKMDEPWKECASHGKLYRDDVIKSGKTKAGTEQYKCRYCMKEMHDKHYALNKAKVLLKRKEYREQHPDKVKESHRMSAKKNRHKHIVSTNLYKKEWDKKSTAELKDRYIKKALVKRTGLSMSDIPQALIDCKRALLQLQRNVKKRKDTEKFNSIEEKLNGKE